jgi:hypothetical protein
MSAISDRIDDLAAALFTAGVEVGYVGGDTFRQVVAERLLASPWLAEVLAAERERIAVAIEDSQRGGIGDFARRDAARIARSDP